MTVNEWVGMVRGLPPGSALFRHDRCRPICTDKRGPRLRPGTIKQVAVTLATYAQPNGANAHPGATVLAMATGRHRTTVIVGLVHLETVGLVMVQARGGGIGLPRWHSTNYWLSAPPLDQLAAAARTPEDRRLYDFFTRPERSGGA